MIKNLFFREVCMRLEKERTSAEEDTGMFENTFNDGRYLNMIYLCAKGKKPVKMGRFDTGVER